MRVPSLFVTVALASSGCGGDGATAERRTMPERLVLEVEATIEPGVEEHLCRYFVVPDGGFDAQRFEHQLPSASTHHAIVHPTAWSRADVESRLGETIRQCNLAIETGFQLGPFVYGAQRGSGSVTFPPGAALRLEPGSVLLLEHHVVNASTEAALARATIILEAGADSPLSFASMVHFYDWAISVPPRGSGSTRMRCVMPRAVEFHFGHAHTHELGRRVRAWRTGSGETELVLDTTGREATTQWDPAIAIGAGEAFEFECTYENASDRTVHQGSSAEADEMCSFTGGAVAADGEPLDSLAELCGAPGSGVIGSGTLDCEGIEACVLGSYAGAAVPASAQECWLDGCENSTLAFYDLALCRLANCEAPCAVDPASLGQVALVAKSAECVACVAGACARAVEGCSRPCD